MVGDWILELFQENAEIFIKFVEKIWSKARELAKSLDKLFKELGIDKNHRILEIGCGNGRVLINLAEIGYRNLLGLDISLKLVQDAHKRAKAYKVDKYIDLIVGDARTIGNLLRRKSVKVIMFIWTTIIGYYDKETDYKILKQCKEIAKENSHLLIIEHSNRDWIAYIHNLLEKITTIYKLDNITIIEETTYNKEKA
ncbi:MAG: class I SAM-dependent methyltransferase, partial [Crenarchaeota archaeon]|nr:class I SAM-dependent methyltransferase [Thermoproteota archaeon]